MRRPNAAEPRPADHAAARIPAPCPIAIKTIASDNALARATRRRPNAQNPGGHEATGVRCAPFTGGRSDWRRHP